MKEPCSSCKSLFSNTSTIVCLLILLESIVYPSLSVLNRIVSFRNRGSPNRGRPGPRPDFAAPGGNAGAGRGGPRGPPRFRGRGFARGGNSGNMFRGGLSNNQGHFGAPRSGVNASGGGGGPGGGVGGGGPRFRGNQNWDQDWNAPSNVDATRNIPPLMGSVAVSCVLY